MNRTRKCVAVQDDGFRRTPIAIGESFQRQRRTRRRAGIASRDPARQSSGSRRAAGGSMSSIQRSRATF